MIVYVLLEPETGAPRYVGRTTCGPLRRLTKHLAADQIGGSSRRATWLRELVARGLRPRMVTAQEYDSLPALRAGERAWIAVLRECGADLVNGNGGGGPGRTPRCAHGHTVGGRTSSEFNSWCAMRARCNDPNNDRYARYGGRGIRVCAGWSTRDAFPKFLSDIGARPGPGYTLDRKDADGHYSCGSCAECLTAGWPANCRWATVIEQANKRSNNLFIEYNGERRTVAEWARVLNMPRSKLASRIERWPLALALDPSIGRIEKGRIDGRFVSPGAAPGTPLSTRPCARCGHTFTVRRAGATTCSRLCSRRHARTMSHARHRERINAARRLAYATRVEVSRARP